MEKAAKPSEAVPIKPALAKTRRGTNPAVIAVISAAAAFLLVFIIFALFGYAPFGSRALLYSDADYQYFDLVLYYKRVFAGQDSFFYSFGKSLGGNDYAVFAYYLASPVMLLSLLFKPEDTALCLNVIAAVKIALAAGTAAYAITGRFSDMEEGRAPYAVMIAVSYGLSQYMISQTGNVMWLDGAVLLPLVILGTYRIVKGKSGLLLCLSIALSLLFNWYTGIINCMFSVFWLLFEIVVLKAALIRSALRYAVYMLSGILASGIILVPALLILSDRSHGSGQLKELLMPGFIGNPLSLISNYAAGEVSVIGSCSLFAGSLVLFGVMLFFLNGSFDKRTKAAVAVFLLFSAMSFVFRPLVTVFSIFRNVESYWYRYSYTGIFLLCVIAAAFFLKGKGTKLYYPLLTGVLFSLVSVLSTIVFRNDTQLYIYTSDINELFGIVLSSDISAAVAKVIMPLIFAAVLFLVILDKHGTGAGFNVAMISIVTALELVLAGGLLFLYYSNDKADQSALYVARETGLLEKAKATDEGGFYRIVQTSERSAVPSGNTANYNEGLGYGFNGVSSFVSDPEEKQGGFLAKLGYPFHSETITVTASPLLPADSLLSVRYVLSEYDCPGMEKITDDDTFKNAYKNPYQLPAAFITESLPSDGGSLSTFEYQNEAYGAITGEKTELYEPADFSVVNEEKQTIYKIPVPEGRYVLYGRFLPKEGKSVGIDVNGFYSLSLGQFLSPDVFVIPFTKDKGEAVVTADCKEPVDAEFYLLDLDRFETCVNKIRQTAASSVDISSGHVKVSATGNSGGEKLFISVPYDPSWKVMRNGTEIVPEAFDGCMTVVSLEKGNNEIVMEYRPPYMTAGLASTAAGLLMTAALAFFYRKKMRKDEPN